MLNESYINLITGDIHEDFKKFSNPLYKMMKLKNLNNIRLFIAGDFGLNFHGGQAEKDKLFKEKVNSLGIEVFSVIGNHENRDVLDQLPVIYRNGGKMYQADDKLFYLMTGETYTFTDENGMSFSLFSFGGGFSTDQKERIEHEKKTGNCIFWEKEMPSDSEYEYARNKLKESENRVDIIISHTSPLELKKHIIKHFRVPGKDIYGGEHKLNLFLEEVLSSVSYKKWFFGHFHCDAIMTPDEKIYAVFEEIRFLKTGELVDANKILREAKSIQKKTNRRG